MQKFPCYKRDKKGENRTRILFIDTTYLFCLDTNLLFSYVSLSSVFGFTGWTDMDGGTGTGTGNWYCDCDSAGQKIKIEFGWVYRAFLLLYFGGILSR